MVPAESRRVETLLPEQELHPCRGLGRIAAERRQIALRTSCVTSGWMTDDQILGPASK